MFRAAGIARSQWYIKVIEEGEEGEEGEERKKRSEGSEKKR